MPTGRTAARDEKDAQRDTVAMVAQALAEGRVALAFQPIVHGSEPGRLAFYEGLIRLFGEDGQPIPAARFIDAVEDHDVGRELDLAALRLGIEALRAQPALRLSINMSVHTIGDPRWRAASRAASPRTPPSPSG